MSVPLESVQLQNLAEVVFRSAEKYPRKTALIYQDRAISYEALAVQVQTLANSLKNLGIQPGDTVGLLAYNTPTFVLGYFALLSFGVAVIPLNTRLTAVEVSTILKDAAAKWLISTAEFADVLTGLDVPSLEGLVLDLSEGELELSVLQQYRCENLEALLHQTSHAKSNPETFAEFNARSLATLIYTSGTTGVPKGVMLSHRNILADATANVQVIEAVADDTFITISPLFHVFGQTNIMVSAFMAGGTIVMIRKFSPKTVLEAIEKYRVTFMAAVPTMYQMMLTYLREHHYDLSSLRVCHSGAAPMAEETFLQVEKYFGAPVQEGYGLSEASSIVCSNPMNGPRKPGSVGLPLPGVTVKIFDEDMWELPTDEIGELHVRGDIVMLGYYNRPEETAKAIMNGWLKTKDLAFRDEDGYIHIVDRKDDLINIGGVKVYPREIEEVFYKHPAVEAVAVTGIPSTMYHEAIKAFVVAKPDVECTKEILREFCKEYLALYKIPQYIDFVDEIPKGATGKILRKELRKNS